MRKHRTITKFQKNRTDRRKTNPTSTNQVEMRIRPVMIRVIPHTHLGLDVLTNEPTKMRGDEMKRKTTTRPMKLEETPNNNTKSINIPYKPRPATKTTTIHSKKRKMTHSDDTVI
ncbi:MAG: hypothetical protein EBR89_11890 [Betaproteobacteria bacterium]|nr:hypothetical protein [Betaproteobacteria bacterium]